MTNRLEQLDTLDWLEHQPLYNECAKEVEAILKDIFLGLEETQGRRRYTMTVPRRSKLPHALRLLSMYTPNLEPENGPLLRSCTITRTSKEVRCFILVDKRAASLGESYWWSTLHAEMLLRQVFSDPATSSSAPFPNPFTGDIDP